ncbi:transglutaminase domain-containing protein [Psychroserpens mesophilus]|uniref:transglutaminase domain-containing protein n=1 Tax=Psychroserpens mesophilus TaxID=325473 RepID=UPI003D661601
MIFKKLRWTFKRHPFLYIARFKLLSKNSNVSDITNFTYNDTNSKNDIPTYFQKVNNIIFETKKPEEDLEVVKHIAIWMHRNIKGGRGLSEPSEKALKMMINGDGGVCSDMVQVFNNFCIINDIQVREWGVTRAPFNKSFGGHSFNEVFCKKLDKWVLIDVSASILFYSNKSAEPLSVIELYQFLRSGETVFFKSFNEKHAISKANVENNFFNPDIVPFLICNYSNKTYDFLLKYSRPYVPIFVSHFILYALNKSYYYKFPLDNYKNIFS